jgi:hypothetical protein
LTDGLRPAGGTFHKDLEALLSYFRASMELVHSQWLYCLTEFVFDKGLALQTGPFKVSGVVYVRWNFRIQHRMASVILERVLKIDGLSKNDGSVEISKK